MKFVNIFSLSLLIISIIIASSNSSAQDLTTANRDRLQRFWTAAEQQLKPVTVISFGDSMADSYRSIPCALMNHLVQRMGVAGYSLNNYQNAMMYHLANGSTVVPPSAFWFMDHYRLPPAAAISWEKETSADGVTSDRAGVFYVSHSEGGVFYLMVSSDQGPWTLAVTVNAQSPFAQGHFAKIDLPLGLHRVRVEGVSGTNFILGPQLLNRTSSGVHAVFADQGGIPIETVTHVPLAIRHPVFQELAPDLLIWHMKEDGGTTTAAGLNACETWWKDAVPNTDVLYIGTPWIGQDSTQPVTLSQNTLVRATALSNNRAYVDCMTPGVNYDWMASQGYMFDETHLNGEGSTYLADIAWNDLNLFLLRRSRSLNIKRQDSGIALEYQTSTRLQYTLEHSSDCVNWSETSSMTGTGEMITRSIPVSVPREFYRLRLNPVD